MTSAHAHARAAATLTVLMAACVSAPDDPSDLTVVRDSAGVTLVTIQAHLADLPEWELSPEPEVSISGSGTGGAPYLSRVRSATWLSDGSILLADDGESRILIYNSDGMYLRSFGREGDGPGEFKRGLRASATYEDSILAFDWTHDWVSVFHPTEGFGRTIPLNLVEPGIYGASAWAIGSDRLLLHSEGYDPTAYTGSFPRRGHRTARLSLYDRTGVLVAGPLDFDGGYSADLPRGDAVFSFANIPAMDVSGDRLVFGSGLDYELTIFDENLEPVAKVSWPGMNDPITAKEVEWLRGEYWELFLADIPAQMADEIITAMLAPKLMPDHRPAIGSIVLDRQGPIWVSRFEPLGRYVPGRPEAWHVLDEGGTPVSRLTLPLSARLMAVDGERVMLLTTDDLDVQHIVIHRVAPKH